MKILLLSDIHKDEDVAKYIYQGENPDLVLDCGDHESLSNLFEFTPHFFVNGNHEPSLVNIQSDSFYLPYRLQSNQAIRYAKNGSAFTFTGIGGNYSSELNSPLSVNLTDIEGLSNIKSGSLDALLLHESPLNVKQTGKPNINAMADKVIYEIKRIRPKFVFSGHLDSYKEENLDESTKIICLGPIVKGYGILTVDGDKYSFERKISNWGSSKR